MAGLTRRFRLKREFRLDALNEFLDFVVLAVLTGRLLCLLGRHGNQSATGRSHRSTAKQLMMPPLRNGRLAARHTYVMVAPLKSSAFSRRTVTPMTEAFVQSGPGDLCYGQLFARVLGDGGCARREQKGCDYESVIKLQFHDIRHPFQAARGALSSSNRETSCLKAGRSQRGSRFNASSASQPARRPPCRRSFPSLHWSSQP